MDKHKNMLMRAATRLKRLRESTGLSQKDFAARFGVNPTTYSRYESGGVGNIPRNIIEAICKEYKINPAWLMGFEEATKHIAPNSHTKTVPVFGSIAAGVPILAQGDLICHDTVSADCRIDFALKVKGDSMINARISDGDIVYIRSQPTVENGEIAAVIINGEEATLKRVYIFDNTIILKAENPLYKDMVFTKKDGTDVRILGKAVFFRSDVR